MARFTDILDTKADEISRPKNLPIGHYVMQLVKLPEVEEIADGRFEKITFQMRVVSPEESVDPDEIEEFGKVEGQPIRKTFLLNTDPEEKAAFERTMFQLKQTLGHFNIGFEDGGDMTIKEAFEAAINAQLIGEVTHRPDKNDPEVIFVEVGKTAPIE